MGQYYLFVILSVPQKRKLNASSDTKVETNDGERVEAWLHAHDFGDGAKLMEHSWSDVALLRTALALLSPDGPYHGRRVAWVGDYADGEPGCDSNLFAICREYNSDKRIFPDEARRMSGEGASHTYLVNHSKKEFVDMKCLERDQPHPLPLLTCEGNGRGGGDYRGPFLESVGVWARDEISVESEDFDARDFRRISVRFRDE